MLGTADCASFLSPFPTPLTFPRLFWGVGGVEEPGATTRSTFLQGSQMASELPRRPSDARRQGQERLASQSRGGSWEKWKSFDPSLVGAETQGGQVSFTHRAIVMPCLLITSRLQCLMMKAPGNLEVLEAVGGREVTLYLSLRN